MANRFLNNISINDQYTLPTSDGSSNQVLATNGSGQLSFVDQTGETAERIEVTVKNVSGGSLSKGTVVHASPSANPPNGNVIEVIAADYDDSTKMPAIGILNETIANEGEGSAVMMGAVSGIDTSSFSIGDELYVGNLGTLTNSKPVTAGQLIQKIAVVIKSHASNGLIKIFGAGRSNDVPLPLYIDNTNQRVGIGDSTPSYTLDVNGTIYGSAVRSGRYYGISGTSSYLDLDSGAPYSLLASSEVNVTSSITCNDLTATETGGIAATNGPVYANRFHGNGNTTYYVDPNDSTTSAILAGKVGIGTTSPGQKLDVSGGIRLGQYSVLEWGGNNSNRLSIQNGLSGATFTTYGSGDIELNPLSGGINFKTAGTSKAKLLANGNFGIGEQSPDELLHISGSVDNDDVAIRIDNDSDDNSSSTPPKAAILFNTASSNGHIRVFGAPADTAANHKMDIGSTASTSYLTFSPSNTEKMRIASSGNVGINVTSPQARLHVDAPSVKAASLTFGAQAGQIFQNENSEFAFGLHNVSPYPLYIQGRTHTNGARQIALNPLGGNIGIGTTSPLTNLHVSSGTSGDATVIIEADTDNNQENDLARLWFKADGGITEGAIQLSDNQLDIISNVSSGSGIVFKTGTTNNYNTTDPDNGAAQRMIITSGGNVGIGVPSPSRPLVVGADSSTAIITLQRTNTTTTGAFGALQWTASDDHSVASISVVGDGNNEGGHMDFRTTSGATNNDPYSNNYLPVRMRITSDGNVEIGDKNYAYGADNYHIALKSTVSSQDQTAYLSNINGTVVISAGGYYYGSDLRQLNSSNTIYGGIRLAEDGEFRLESLSGGTGGSTASATTKFKIDSNGNTFSYGNYIRSQYDGNHYAQIENNSSGGVLKAVDGGATTVMFRSYGDSYVTNDFGLGVTSPDEKLHVDGNTRITSRLYNTQHTSSSLSSGQWYRIVEITGSSGRGKCEFSIGGSGGSGTPSLVKATVNTAWSNTNSTIKVDFNSKSSAFSEFRVVRNATSNKSFVDVKLGGSEDSVLLQVYPIAWDSAYAVDFTNVTTLPSGDSVETSVPLTNTAFALANNNGSDVDPVFKVDHDSKVHAEEFIGQRVIVNGNAYHSTANSVFQLYSTAVGMTTSTSNSMHHPYTAIIMPFNGVVEKVIIKNVKYSSYSSGPSASGTARIQLKQYDSTYAPMDYSSGNVSFTAAANVSMTFSPNQSYSEGTHFRVFWNSSAIWRYVTFQIVLKQTS